MAEKFPTPEELAAARSALDKAEKAYAEVIAAQSTVGDPIYKGVLYKRSDSRARKALQAIADELNEAQKDAKANLEVVEKPVKELKQKSKELGRKINVLPGQTAPQGPSKAAAEKAAIDKRIADVEKAPKPAGKAPAKPAAKPAAKPQETTSAADFRQVEQAGVQPTTPETAPTPTPTAGGTGGMAGGKNKRGGKKKGETAAQQQQWATIVQQEFGSLWDVYNMNPDVKAVLDKSVKEGWFNDNTKLTAALTNTGWYRTTQQSARQFAIRQSTDPASLDSEIAARTEEIRQSALANGLTLSDDSLRKVASDSIKFGYSATQQASAIGSEAVATAQMGGAQGIRDLRSGQVGQRLRQTATAYAQKVNDTVLDSFIVDIMEGRKTEQQFLDLMRSSAKKQFRSLQSDIDQGQDVETAMYAYKQAAQQTLGDAVDMTQIDWTQDKWNKALNFRDEKTNEFRQMDLWEWNKYLRTLPEWQNTNEAKQTYSNVAYALAQGFGKIA